MARILRWTLAILVAACAAPLAATDYVITTFADDSVANGNCTLREALYASRDDFPRDLCPAGSAEDHIQLGVGTYPFHNGEFQVLTAASFDVTITGASSICADTFIDLGGANRFLDLFTGSVELVGLAIGDGHASGSGGGGAVRASEASLWIVDSCLDDNEAAVGGALDYSALVGNGLVIFRSSLSFNDSLPGVTTSYSGSSAARIVLGGGSTAVLVDSTFVGNRSVEVGGPPFPPVVAEGAVWVRLFDSAEAGLARLRFESNTVRPTPGSGQLFADGVALSLSAANSSTVTVRDLRVVGNDGGTGSSASRVYGALAAGARDSALIDLSRVVVDGNEVDPAFASQSAQVVLDADGNGRIRWLDSQVTRGGLQTGIVAQSEWTIEIAHSTIASNGEGLDLSTGPAGTIYFENSISAFNGVEVTSAGNIVQEANWIGSNPGFVDLAAGDFRLAPSSGAIDAGSDGLPTVRLTDAAHGPRRVGAASDLGAYERRAIFADGFDDFLGDYAWLEWP